MIKKSRYYEVDKDWVEMYKGKPKCVNCKEDLDFNKERGYGHINVNPNLHHEKW